MKTQLKHSINNLALILLMLMAGFVFGFGCNPSKPTLDPLVGFHWSSLANLDNNKTVTDDYKSYIQTLSPEEQKRAGPVFYYEDGTGQHAVEIKIGINGSNWHHVLIYDKDNKRIKKIKYISGNYA